MSDNKRRFTRVGFVTDACLETAAGRYPAQILNLSLRGVLLEVQDLTGQPPPSPATIRFQLKGSTIELRFQGVLAHHQDTLLGYRFSEINQDSMIHLRSLLEYNLGDAERIKAEVYRLVD